MNDRTEADNINPCIIYANEYARSLGYEALWNPFNSWSTYYYRWQEMKFTRATMQINYFPDGPGGTHQLNDQPEEQIKSVAERTADGGMGVTMEWSYLTNPLGTPEGDGVRHFKKYMEGGIKYGYMNRPYINYQLDGGPDSIYTDCLKSGKPYIKSLYGEMYKFIKGVLKSGDITWN